MLVQEVFSIFAFAFIVGLGYLSNFFLHRVEVKPLTVSNEVRKLNNYSSEFKKKTYLVILSGKTFWPIYF
jgi:hypothetical protein